MSFTLDRSRYNVTFAVVMILVAVCSCGDGKDGSTGTPEVVQQMPTQEAEQLVDDERDVSPRNAPEDLAVETSEPDYIDMPRPGIISRYDKIVRKYARRYLFDWRLISAQIYTESRFRHQARSYRGALGLMQIMPGTAQWLEEKVKKNEPGLGSASQMLLDPEVNIHLGCYYDAMLHSRVKNIQSSQDRHKMMFAAYNAGAGNLNRARRKSDAPGSWEGIEPHLPGETRKYVPTIYDRYDIYRQWAVLRPY